MTPNPKSFTPKGTGTSHNYTESDPIARNLKTVALHFHKEDDDVRQWQVRYYKRLKYYWNNLSQIFWSNADGDYRIFGNGSYGTNYSSGAGDQAYYDKPVNVFKAFLETIIAALSVQVPSISCVPDDADNPQDLLTAKAGNIISKQLYKHNDAISLWLQALYIYCTEGMIAYYTYTHESKEYGTYQEEKIENIPTEGFFCPQCQTQLDEESVMSASLMGGMNGEGLTGNVPLGMSGEIPPEEPIQPPVCPECGTIVEPNLPKQTLEIPTLTGYTDKPKSRVCMEVYGGLYVKVAQYAKKQCDTPYLIFSYETNYVNVLEEYPELKDKLPQGGWSNIGINDPYEQYARLNIQYRNLYPKDLVTVKYCWLRPEAFNILSKEDSEKLHETYPDGVMVCLVNDVVAEYKAEKLDDHWTLTQNPMSDYLTHQPLGEVLTNIQDITNDLISLTIQTIEHGISTTWVDPALVNVNEYGQVEATPGNVIPIKTQGGNRNISEGFHATSTAALQPEVIQFYKIIQELGQFVSGALPSIFGGAMPGSGETASEYKESQRMAMQRLQTPWKMLTSTWKSVMGKSITAYMKCVQEDERLVEKDINGNFINTFIRKSELVGKIGDVELDSSDQLPVSEESQRQLILELMQLNNMEIFNALVDPNNLPWVRKIVRIPEFKLPGEDDRQKQLEEIQEMLLVPPVPMGIDEMTGMDLGQTSSVPIDPILDNHQVEADVLRNWLVGEAGRLAKKENPEGYMNCLLHFQEHITQLNKAMAMSKMQETDSSSENGNEESNNSNSGKQPSGNQGEM